MIPLINTSNRMEGTPTVDNSSAIHWLVPSSVAAVRNIQQIIKMKSGFKHSFIISTLDTPKATRSD